MSVSVHGHRGARARMPENSLAGFEYAIGCGVDALEMDLVVTRDSLIVISHDPIAERGVAPTLDEVFGLRNRGSFQYDLEIKTWTGLPPCPAPQQYASMVLAKISDYQIESRVIVMSFDFRVLAAIRKARAEIRLCVLTEGDPREFRQIAEDAARAEIIAPHLSLVTPAKVSAAHAAGLQVLVWTANTPREWDYLIAADVDGIITDDPETLISHLWT